MKFALVDGYSLIFRAFHAVPEDLATSHGERTNAVFGFCNMLLATMQRERPDGVAVAFDVGRAFRHEEYAQYKAHRTAAPPELTGQIERVRQVVGAFGFPTFERSGYEADDVIGSLSRRLEALGHEVIVVTSDSDLLQLVTDRVFVAMPAHGRFSDVRVYDPEAVRERYGFGPELIPDYKALVGDTSDNVPGVPGVGEKTAKNLIHALGGVEQILARLDEVTPERIRRAIGENSEQLVQSRRLCTVVTDLDVDPDPLLRTERKYDREALVRQFRELEFRSLLNRLPPSPDSRAEAEPEPRQQTVLETSYVTLETPDAVREVVSRLLKSEVIAFDTETDRKSAVGAELVGVSFSGEEGTAYYVPIGHDGHDSDRDALLGELRPLLEGGPRKVAHNAKFDYMVLLQHGIEVRPLAFDTSIAAFLLNETSVGLKELAATRLGVEMTPIEKLIGRGKSQLTMNQVPADECGQYACADADMTLRLYSIFRRQLEERDQMRLLEELEMPLVPVLSDMELAGISIDAAALAELSRKLYKQILEIESSIKELAGYDFNLKSPQQLGKVLFEDLGLRGTRRTAKGAYSTDAQALESLQGQHPMVELILQYRQLTKLKDTYLDALPLLVNPGTGRVHTSFSQTSASTGRLASTDPNLQNIPVRTELGREVRRAFIASNSPENAIMPGPTVLLSTDYSQIELRVLAHLTGEQKLRDAFARDEDIHALTAARLYNVPLSRVTSDMRRTGKTINFGIIYGMSGFRLARDTGLSQREAANFVRRYMDQFPSVQRFFDRTVALATERGYVETPMGRRRYLPDLTSSNPQRRDAARRAAINMPIQGMAADIMKLAMIRVHHRLREGGHRGRMLLQVHDELVFEVPEAELREVAALVLEEMGRAIDLDVPLKAEAKWGRSWGNMTPLMEQVT